VPLSDVTRQQIVKFIVCHFRLPHTITSDNRTTFASLQVMSYYSKCKITQKFFTPYYLQGNGQAEINNRTILDGLHKSLNKAKGKWVEKLLVVLSAYKTTKCVPMGKITFSLVYRTEAIIPVDICMPTLLTTNIDQSQNTIQLGLTHDQSKKSRREAQIELSTINNKLRPLTIRRSNPESFKLATSTKEKNLGKLGPNWEGPYP